jgi:hypothetical protein
VAICFFSCFCVEEFIRTLSFGFYALLSVSVSLCEKNLENLRSSASKKIRVIRGEKSLFS